MSGRIVVVGIDGARFDSLAQASTPTLDAVAARGFRVTVQVNPAGPTISGPCWATIATGTLPPVHGVMGNESPSARMPLDFLAVARQAGRSTFAAVSWRPLLQRAECGPIFAPGGAVMIAPESGHDLALWDRADAAVATEAARALAGDVDAAFVYFGLADEVAHAKGVGPEYVSAIEACDARLRTVLDGAHALSPDSTWTVIVVTDHGHVDAGGHGGDSPQERTAWICACGPGLPAGAPVRVQQADVYAQVLATLGIAGDDDRYGRPFGQR